MVKCNEHNCDMKLVEWLNGYNIYECPECKQKVAIEFNPNNENNPSSKTDSPLSIKNKKSGVYNTLYLLALWIFIFILIFFIMFVIKYKDDMNKDPFMYGMKAYNFESCLCFDNQGRDWTSVNQSYFVHKERDPNYGKLNYKLKT